MTKTAEKRAHLMMSPFDGADQFDTGGSGRLY
jgi:hypothetical protein